MPCLIHCCSYLPPIHIPRSISPDPYSTPRIVLTLNCPPPHTKTLRAGKILFVTYPSASRTILSAFHCHDGAVEGEGSTIQLRDGWAVSNSSTAVEEDYGTWLNADPEVSCNGNYFGYSFQSPDTYRDGILVYAVVMLLLFCFGIPALIFGMLWKQRYPVNMLYDITNDGTPSPALACTNLKSFYWQFDPSFW